MEALLARGRVRPSSSQDETTQYLEQITPDDVDSERGREEQDTEKELSLEDNTKGDLGTQDETISGQQHNDNTDVDEELGTNASVLETFDLEAGASSQSSVRRKGSTPKKKNGSRVVRTLEALKTRIEEEDVSHELPDSWTALQNITEELEVDDGLKIQEDDYYHIGELVFCRMFGEGSKCRLYNLLTEGDYRNGSSFDGAVHKVGMLVDKLGGCENPQLGSFIMQWGSVMDKAVGMQTVASQLRTYVQQYNLWKGWMELKEFYGEQTQMAKLQDFLREQGFETGQGKGLDSCLAAYFAKELGLGEGKKFADTIYRFTVLGILVEVLGMGVLVFLPKNIESWYKQLKGGKGGRFGSVKRRKIELVCRALVEKVPALANLCDDAQKNVIDRILYGRESEMTQAMEWIRDGKEKDSVMKLPMEAFVGSRRIGQVVGEVESDG